MIGRLLHHLHLADRDLIEQFADQSVSTNVQTASQHLLSALGVSIKVTGKLPKLNGPQIIIANHHGGLDSHVLLSIINREDFAFVALSTYHIFGLALLSRLLPIYRKKSWNRRLFEYPLNIKLDSQVQNMSESAIRQLNRETITEAARRVSTGWAVSIFPEGSVGKNITQGSWKAGVGYLIKQIKNDKTQIVFAKISGHDKSDLYRYIRPDWRKILFKPKSLTVTFSEPILLSQLQLMEMSGKQIAAKLELIYKSTFPN